MRMLAPVALMLTLISAASADEPVVLRDEPVVLRPSDFAFGVPIQTTTEGPLFEIALPRAVYETATRADLGDLRVFNARGEVVPYMLRAPGAPKAASEWTRLSFFPVRVPGGGPDWSALRFQTNRAGAITGVQAGQRAAHRAPVVGYLVDASADSRPIDALEMNWKNPKAGGFSGDLRVDASDDLQQWRTVVAAAPLARLSYQGQLLERRRVEFPPVHAKYLRLVWLAPERTVMLSEIRSERLAEDIPLPPPREWATPVLAGRGEHPGEYSYHLGGYMPVDRARVRLPQVSTVAAIELLSRANATDTWRTRATGLAYRVSQNGHEVTGDDLSFSPAAAGDREWRLRLSPRETGWGPEPPVLELGWVPQRLVFVARGEGPFLLAYGSAGMLPGGLADERLLQESVVGDGKNLTSQPATLSAPLTLGGGKRLKVPFTAYPWRKWLLWSAIALGVFLVGVMINRRARP